MRLAVTSAVMDNMPMRAQKGVTITPDDHQEELDETPTRVHLPARIGQTEGRVVTVDALIIVHPVLIEQQLLKTGVCDRRPTTMVDKEEPTRLVVHYLASQIQTLIQENQQKIRKPPKPTKIK